MSAEQNTAVLRRQVDEVMNQGKVTVIDELFAPNIVQHAPGAPDIVGLDDFRHFIVAYRTAFPNVRMTIEDLVAADDRVVARYTFRGTQQGELMGIAPTGKAVNVPGVAIARFAGGKIAEVWLSWDTLGMMQQLGVVPAAAPATA